MGSAKSSLGPFELNIPMGTGDGTFWKGRVTEFGASEGALGERR